MITPLSDRWQGSYYDGQTPLRYAADVSLTSGGLRIETDSHLSVEWPYPELTLAQGEYSGEPIRLERGGKNPEVIVVDDRRFLTALRQHTEFSTRQFAETPLSRVGVKQTLLAAFGAIALIAGLYLWGAQFVANTLAAIVPVSWEERLGNSIMPWVADEDDLCHDDRKQKAVTEIAERLLAEIPDRRYNYRFLVAHGSVNALTAPGGQIVIFDGLLAITDRPEQLAGVLAHEIQHANFRHTTRTIFRNAALQALVAAVTGDASGGGLAFEQAAEFGGLAHQRSEEDQADREGVKLMVAAGIDPNGMVEIFEKFDDLLGDDPWGMLSTHPSTESRLQNLRVQIDEIAPEIAAMPVPSDWEAIQKPCRPG